MKFGIFRHENAFGNSACHVYALARHLAPNKDKETIVYYEKQFQKYFAMCIPYVHRSNIKKFPVHIKMDYTGANASDTWGGYNNELLKDIKMPNVYPFPNTYPSDWSDLTKGEDVHLCFPYDIYNNKHKLPSNAIVMTIRERGTYWKRVDGNDSEPSRSVDPQTFFKIALHYADKGYTIVRLGDSNQTPMPKHDNIIDFAMYKNRNILDDLYVISRCALHLSCDSGIWPMTVGLGKMLLVLEIILILLTGFQRVHQKQYLKREIEIIHMNN
jgi:hypothetical protein